MNIGYCKPDMELPPAARVLFGPVSRPSSRLDCAT